MSNTKIEIKKKYSQLSLFLSNITTAKTVVIVDSNESIEIMQREINFFNKDLRILKFKDWEVLPYDPISPYPELITERVKTLLNLYLNTFDMLLISPIALCHLIPPKEFIEQNVFDYKINDAITTNELIERLINAGYVRTDQVYEHGEFSVRGSLLDFFPSGSSLPFRINILKNSIESIRTFDPDTQRTVYKVNKVEVIPAREFPTNKDGIKKFRQNYRNYFSGDPTKSYIYTSVTEGINPNGIEYYIPLFFDECNTIFDFLPNGINIFDLAGIKEISKNFYEEMKERFSLVSGNIDRPVMAPENLFLNSSRILKYFETYELVSHEEINLDLFTKEIDLNIDFEKLSDDHNKLTEELSDDYKVCITFESLGKLENSFTQFSEKGVEVNKINTWTELINSEKKVNLINSPIKNSFISKKNNIIIISETDTYDYEIRSRNNTNLNKKNENFIKNIFDLTVDDFIVHEKYGIGKYCGLKTITNSEINQEFMVLEYFDSNNLLIPINNLNGISRYASSDNELVKLSKLGTNSWEKKKLSAKKAIKDTAAELLQLYAQREFEKSEVYKVNHNSFNEFCSTFKFDLTLDQKNTLDEIINDFESEKKMDRLICGDVGFGKTEIAVRASFITADNSKQVIVLVPTTILAEQHFNVFSERFLNTNFKVAELSRFKSSKDIANNIKNFNEGKIHILVGTHKILSSKLDFSDVGLMIIDEEHRFGVNQKEKIKKIKSSINILTLTATPIPRTLSISLDGLRDLSVIKTPPKKRLSVKTIVCPIDNSLIKEAIHREVRRGGQVFYLNNDIKEINETKRNLEKMLPNLKVEIAHGQMNEKELEIIMKKFYAGKFEILLTTTIIENGIDVPRANTIIIHRADKLGLAQLHQLRGRVGRSYHQAYAYLFFPREVKLKKVAKKRLEAIQKMDQLGSGLFLAIQDLEIRGAGEILGEEQSGEIQKIGYELYNKLLRKTINSLKRNSSNQINDINENIVEIKMNESSLLPENYCPNTHERLLIYKKLSNSANYDEVLKVKEEIIDRFGRHPVEVENLIDSHHLRILSEGCYINKIDFKEKEIILLFNENPNLNVEKLLNWIKKEKFVMSGENKIKISIEENNLKKRVNYLLPKLKEIERFVIN